MDSTHVCQVFNVNDTKIQEVSSQMKDAALFLELSEFFKVLGDPTRLKIIYALSCEELCVCELSKIVGVSQSGLSHQLRVLRSMHFVKYRREGRAAYYSLDDEHVTHFFTEALNHIEEHTHDS